MERHEQIFKAVADFYKSHQNGRCDGGLYWTIVTYDIQCLRAKHGDDRLFINLLNATIGTLTEEYEAFKSE